MTRWLSLLLPALFVLQGTGCASYYFGGPVGCDPYGYGCNDCGEVGCTDHIPVPRNAVEHVANMGRGLVVGCGDPYYGEWRSYPPDCDSCNNAAAGQPFTLFSGFRTLWGHREHGSIAGGCSSCEAYPTPGGDYFEGEEYYEIHEGESIMTPGPEAEQIDPPGPLPGPDSSAMRTSPRTRRSSPRTRNQWTSNTRTSSR